MHSFITHRTTSTVASLVAAALLALGCGPLDEADPFGEVARSDKQRVTSPQVADADFKAQVAGNNDFALRFYGTQRAAKGNLFFSAHSISTALAMLHAGARGTTEAEMATALSFKLPQASLHPAFNKLDLELESRGKGKKAADGQPFRLKIANAIWGQTGYTFLPAYLDTLAVSYGAGLRLLDFSTQPEPSRQTINAWVENRTEGRIKDLLKKGTITPDTTLVLTNAIYFNAAWAKQFEAKNTQSGTFTTLGGAQVQAPMMHGVMPGSHMKGQGFQAFTMPYDGDELSMLVILPDAGSFGSVEQGLCGQKVADIVAKLSTTDLELTFPRFEFEAEINCKDPLKALGMKAAFSASADLSGIDGSRSLVVSDVVHKAFVKVNESGTEAAAATAVVVGRTSVPSTVKVTVDRPFVFFIRDHKTGAIVFSGRIADPTK